MSILSKGGSGNKARRFFGNDEAVLQTAKNAHLPGNIIAFVYIFCLEISRLIKMEKKKHVCINCNSRPVSVTWMVKPPFAGIYTGLLCNECLKDNPEPDHCLECGKKLVTMKDKVKNPELKFNGEPGLCYECRNKKLEEAKREGKCTFCYVFPQSDLIDNSGNKTTFCDHCLRMWTRMCDINELNYRINEQIQKKLKDKSGKREG